MTVASNVESGTDPTLRSSRWFGGDDETALQNRAALKSLGIEVADGRPIIGISDTTSDFNPCNSAMSAQIEAARAAVFAAGGTPVVFPTISLGEDLMKPTAMLYRNLLSIEIEEMVRSYPIDALILTGNCDKTIPGALMGAISANVPTVMIIGGARPVARFRGALLASGTDLWKAYDQHRAGTMSDEDWAEFERCYSCGLGACNVMGTAVTMAIVAETLGFTIPGSATIPAGEDDGVAAAADAGTLAVQLALNPIRPQELVSRESLTNALKAVAACGGSTNALVHIVALAGRVGIRLTSDDLRHALDGVCVLADVQPIGSGFAQDFHESGGVPALLSMIRSELNLGTANVEGSTLDEVLRQRRPVGTSIRHRTNPIKPVQALAVISGTLAPDGAVIKVAAASPHLLNHRGRAVVFKNYSDMRERIDDPLLDVDANSVLVLQHAGPVGGPGMPEWGMIPIPAKLARRGIVDIVRVSDGRMSGTSFGTVVLHVSPESAVGGPLALVRDGDLIHLNIAEGRIDLEVDADELELRRRAWTPEHSRHQRGWTAMYEAHVTQASEGCDLDFLQALLPGSSVPVEPIVGRS